MRNVKVPATLGVLAVVLFILPGVLLAAVQTLVLHQNLAEMVAEADRIYRGTVTSIEAGDVDINGTLVPATTYRIRITDHFKGAVDQEKDDLRIAELRVVGTMKKFLRTEGDFAQLPVLPELPRLEVGEEYLLFTNSPNAYGLSNTIGLGQGYFSITFAGSAEVCANQLDNLGLFNNMGTGMPSKGAVAYAELASIIRAEIAGAGGQP